ncbi:hypothetical protein [Alloactinosynnema sp. L-07]|uniref:hypothetical protein n=1 Tax=Alloactinosynnema sp. L-07 TaxID=1653480 RepID=UPI00065F02AA|nr:hypothetical protein [Alloactinosynnema sp. L-07]CRK61474.1 hypothetical protein [Alloactinosynnema sp. L-07]
MTAELVLIALAFLLVYGLDRNHHRNNGPRPRLAGHTDVEDRDLARTVAETETRERQDAQRTTARTGARVRLAIGSR